MLAREEGLHGLVGAHQLRELHGGVEGRELIVLHEVRVVLVVCWQGTGDRNREGLELIIVQCCHLSRVVEAPLIVLLLENPTHHPSIFLQIRSGFVLVHLTSYIARTPCFSGAVRQYLD
jgi:hypothetical protein